VIGNRIRRASIFAAGLATAVVTTTAFQAINRKEIFK